MKKTIITIALALMTVSLSAEEIAKNNSTGMALSEVMGNYTISGPHGALILGDKEKTVDILTTMEGCFIKKRIEFINWGDQKYEVGSDKEGLYIIKVGMGAVKVRQSDVTIFLASLGVKAAKEGFEVAKEKGSKIWNTIKEK